MSRYLNVGCGGHFHKDWVNVDFNSYSSHVIAHNLLKGIPFNDNEFAVVYHSHVLEHFYKKDTEFFTKECCRVLKSGGILRICVPDLENLVRTYLNCLERCLNGDENAYADYEWIMQELYDQSVRISPGGGMFELFRQGIPNEDFVRSRLGSEVDSIKHACQNQIAPKPPKKHKLKYWKNKLREWLLKDDLKHLETGKFRAGGEIHNWMYDRFSLRLLLENCGFKEVSFKNYNDSSIENWNLYGLDMLDEQERRPNSLYAEAVK